MAKKSKEIDLALLHKRDPQAVQAWFLEYADRLYTFVFYRVNKDQDLAIDIVQELFLHALQKITQFDQQRGSMYSWLTFLSRNIIKKSLRQNNRHHSLSQLWDGIDEQLLAAYQQIESAPLPPQVLEKKETKELIHLTLCNLPENYQRILHQRYFTDIPIRKIAQLSQASESTVRSLLYRARLAFKKSFLVFADSNQNSPNNREVEL